MFHRALGAGALVVAVLSPFSAAFAEGASLPAHADVRAGRCVEPALFRLLVADRYHVEFSKVIATDIDRDGDIDVVATADRIFTVWVNDGDGHLTSQRPTHGGPGIDARAPARTWSGDGDRSDPSTNDGASATALLVARAHAPPVLNAGDAALLDCSARLSSRIRCSAPRAPPL
jgi:hypothetical protein